MAENSKPLFVRISAIGENQYHLIRLDIINHIVSDYAGPHRKSTIYAEKYQKGNLDIVKLYSSDTVEEIEAKILNALL